MPFKVILTDFVLVKPKIEKFDFMKGEPYFFENNINIRLLGGEHAMVLRYHSIFFEVLRCPVSSVHFRPLPELGHGRN